MPDSATWRRTLLNHEKKLSLLVVAACVALVIWQGLVFFSDSTSDNVGSDAATASTSPMRGRTPPQIAQYHLFGTPPSDRSAANAQPVQRDSGSLRLRGTLAAADDDAFALLMGPSGAEKPYRVGSELPDGSRLLEVHASEVIVERNGRRESISLEKNTSSSGGTTVASARQGSATAATVENPNDPRNMLRNQRSGGRPLNLSGMDPSQVASMIQPLQANGGTRGFRLQPGSDPAILKRFGLQAGDVVLAVNGERFDEGANAFAMMQRLRGAKSAEVLIERNGSEQTVTVDLSDLQR